MTAPRKSKPAPRKRPGRLPAADFDVLLVVGLDQGVEPSLAAPFKAWWEHYALEFLEVATVVAERKRAPRFLGRIDDVYVLAQDGSPLDAKSKDGSLRSMFQDFKDEDFTANLLLAGHANPLMVSLAREARKAGIRTFVLDEQTSGRLAPVHAAGARAVRYDPERLLD